MGDLHRFYASDLSPDEVRLDPAEGHHAANVLRLAPGSDVELFDGRGGKAAGRIARVGRSDVAVAILRREAPAARPRPLVHLAFSTPKGKRLDWLLEKATELGAASLCPVVFERSVAGGELTDAKRQRRLGHCVAAAKQCGLDFLPQLRPPVRLADFLATLGGSATLVGDLADDAQPLPQALRNLHADQDVCLLVGPEGGLAEGERAAVLAAGVRPVRLGGTVLRIETAAIALLAATVALCHR